jgi:hypothetical protein
VTTSLPTSLHLGSVECTFCEERNPLDKGAVKPRPPQGPDHTPHGTHNTDSTDILTSVLSPGT